MRRHSRELSSQMAAKILFLSMSELKTLIFNSWVRASIPRVIAGTGICK